MSIIESIEKINSYICPFGQCDDFYSDQMAFDAVLMNFVVLGEMTSKLPDKFIAETSEIVE
ncbi:DUF86 domain-containing protein [Desulfobotulus sp. H1]|uniref:DUF86 domain-containing protein n=1 Tax=Desulfobotulus pelophilus TaxID=2823377 RepID=A0ABT3NCT7_9BACT|nr:HepT-like ribonuclease domain-containing protein [Desulfobotulus pelophilus]MCW7755278.1 DUF86 domain-containing protein [Desulfobotulus pelophilus]